MRKIPRVNGWEYLVKGIRRVLKKMAAIVVVLGLTHVGPEALAGGDKPDRDGFITQVGSYRLYHGKLTLRFFENKGKLNYEEVGTIRRLWVPFIFKYEETRAGGPADPWIEKGSNWFAFAESPKERSPKAVWIYSGRDKLLFLKWVPAPEGAQFEPGTLLCTQSEYDPDTFPSIVNNVPNPVLDRLPRSFKRKLDARTQSPDPGVPRSLNQRNQPAPAPAR